MLADFAAARSVLFELGSLTTNVSFFIKKFHGSNARLNADSALCFWLPLVTDETRKGWEAYAAENQHQL
jgi:hypothetical protein